MRGVRTMSLMDMELRDALARVERELEEAERVAVKAELDATVARRRATALSVAVENLRAAFVVADETSAEAIPGVVTPEVVVTPEATAENPRRKVQTSQHIIDLLKSRGTAMTRDEIVTALGEAAVTKYMKSPVGAIQTSLTRNVKLGTIKLVGGDRYADPAYREEDNDGPATNDLGD